MFSTPHRLWSRARAFTLVEILVVMAIIGVILTLAVPAVGPMLKSSKVTSTGDDLKYMLASARQRAIADNKPVDIRFLSYVDPMQGGTEARFRAYVIGRYDVVTRNGSERFEFRALENVKRLPEGVSFSNQPAYSTLTEDNRLTKGTHELPLDGINSIQYQSFTFRPDGSTNLPRRSGDYWFVTVLNELEEKNAAGLSNFVTIMIDPFSGSIRQYQP